MAHLDLSSIKQVEHAQGAGSQMQLFFPQVPPQIWWDLLREAAHSISLIAQRSGFTCLAPAGGSDDAGIFVHCWLWDTLIGGGGGIQNVTLILSWTSHTLCVDFNCCSWRLCVSCIKFSASLECLQKPGVRNIMVAVCVSQLGPTRRIATPQGCIFKFLLSKDPLVP